MEIVRRTTNKLAKISPIHVIFQPELDSLERRAVMQTVASVTRIGRASEITIAEYPFDDIQRSIEAGLRASSAEGKLNAEAMLQLQTQGHYKVVVIRYPIYSGDQEVFGIAWPGLGAIISTGKLDMAPYELRQRELKKTTAHELGHVFGLISEARTDNITMSSGGKHCTNQCIMDELATYTYFCEPCTKDLIAYFKK